MRYLSPRWIDAAREALADDDALAAALSGVTLTVEQVVTGVPAEVPADVPADVPAAGPSRGFDPGPHDPSGLGSNGGTASASGRATGWHIAIDDGRVTLASGPAQRPDLRFTTSYDTAAQIASGALSAQRAFVEGRLRVGGDLSLLIAHQRAIAAVDDALSAVRAQTTYD